MDDRTARKIRSLANQVVAKASRPGGLLDQGEFTIAVARRQISEQMGLGPDGLDDDHDLKTAVKKAVREALEKPQEDSAASASGNFSDNEEEQRSQSGGEAKANISNGKSTAARTGKAKATKMNESNSKGTIKVQRKSKPKPTSSAFASSDRGIVESGDDSDGKEGEAVRSESEMSSLYDEMPPTKKRRKSTQTDMNGKADDEEAMGKRKGALKTSGKKKKDPNEGLTSDEIKVVELKKIVVACGVRKQWSKEFADLPDARSQKDRLERMLRELGMKGQPTLGKARTLKEKRELASELGIADDVQEFEATRGLSGGRGSRSKKQEKKNAVNEDSEEGSEADEPRKKSAMGAIMDFLGDQSD